MAVLYCPGQTSCRLGSPRTESRDPVRRNVGLARGSAEPRHPAFHLAVSKIRSSDPCAVRLEPPSFVSLLGVQTNLGSGRE
jgi:hypothetical protein